MISGLLSLAGAAILVVIDQLIKHWATAALLPVGSMDVLPGVVELRYCLNDGMAFSMLAGKQTLLIGMTSVMLVVVAAMLWFVEIGQMPGWALLVVIIREFSVSGLRMVAADKGRVIAAGWSGKVKTASTMVCIVLMFLPIAVWINHICVAVIVLTTIYSGVEYFMKNLDILSEVK